MYGKLDVCVTSERADLVAEARKADGEEFLASQNLCLIFSKPVSRGCSARLKVPPKSPPSPITSCRELACLFIEVSWQCGSAFLDSGDDVRRPCCPKVDWWFRGVVLRSPTQVAANRLLCCPSSEVAPRGLPPEEPSADTKPLGRTLGIQIVPRRRPSTAACPACRDLPDLSGGVLCG
ncbi:uncharacterized protein LOC143277338 [Babylonia areolata]|uniref:uncharacterized protein LOC143277338 n=1 Tax=Babylonia areolata TaxID=304850 RepID=UPI003FD38560